MPNLLIDGSALSAQSKGVGKYSYHLVDQLSRRLGDEWLLNVITFEKTIPEFEGGHRLRVLRTLRLPDLIKGLVAIPAWAVMSRADMILLPMEAVAITMGRPTFVVVHDIDELIVAAGKQQRRLGRQTIEAVRGWWRKRLLRSARLVVCNSEFTLKEVANRYGVPFGRLAVGYCGVDPRFFDMDRSSDRVVTPAAWSGYTLAFATGDPREQYSLYPAVWRHVRAKLGNVGLVVGGARFGWEYVAELRKAFREYGMVEGREYSIVGFLGDGEFGKLRALYREADFYLDLSAHEGFGMQLAEAMATGTTCISSTNSGLGEIGAGYSIPLARFEPEYIATTIIDSYRKQLHLRENGEQVSHVRKFNWDAVGALLEKAIRSEGQ